MFKHENLTYNPLQREAYPHAEEDCNLVVSAPTSSGKTQIAEMVIRPKLEVGERAIYLSPLKALTNEKLEDWQTKVSSIMAVTGDHMLEAKPINRSLVLMTTEALDSKSRGAQNWLNKVGVLVSDESHLLSSPGRGDAFEIGLTRFAQINPAARLVFLSATIPNAQELARWLTILNGKETKVIDSDWRPVEQEYILREMPNRYYDFIDTVVQEVIKCRKKHDGCQFLIFVHTVNMGNTISKRLKCPFHYSKVNLEDRRRIEEGFRQGNIKTLVATSTLAYGLNLPADVGFIVGAQRGPTMVDPVDIKQEAGRIGRYGLSEKGYVYFLFPEWYADEVYDQVIQIPDINSVLPDRLYFHITSFIAREHMQRKEIDDFLSATLGYQQTTLRVEEAISLLKQYEIVYEEEGGLRASSIGRGAALMYIDPIDLYWLKQNFYDRPMTPTAIAKAYAIVPSNMVHTYVPHSLGDQVECGYGQATILATCLRDWLDGYPMDGLRSVIVPPVVKDIDRTTSAMKIAGLHRSYLDSLSLMIKNGIHSQVIDLVSTPGIGRKRAMSLYNRGIKSQQDILNNPSICKNVLGGKVFKQVEEKISSPNTVFLNY